jgi:hypothetical protein
MVAIVTIAAWSFCVTYIIAFFINAVPGMQFRSPLEQELHGDDWGEMGELVHDHVEHPEKKGPPIAEQWGGGQFTVTSTAKVGGPVPNPRLRKTFKVQLRGSAKDAVRNSEQPEGDLEAVEMKDEKQA